MKTKNIGITLLIISLFAIMVLALNNIDQVTLLGGSVSPTTGQNISGSTFNLSAQVQNNGSVSNISFMWQLTSNHSFMANITVSNSTPGWNVANNSNQTHFNTTFDTTSLPDGIYNVSLMIFNLTHEGLGQQNVTINESASVTVTVDNTNPLVVNKTNTSGTLSPIHLFGHDTLILNWSVKDISVESALSTAQPGLVLFQVSNSTGKAFNLTPTNRSGTWAISLNLSLLRGGTQTVTVYVNDTATNKNYTETLQFEVNTPLNVTWFSASNKNYSARNTTVLFNVSVGNRSNGTIPFVVLQFSNGTSGTPFNLTSKGNNISRTSDGRHFFNFTFNVSTLEGGANTITLFANNTHGYYNNTETMNFTVDKSGPSISVLCSDSKVVGDTVTCTCTATDVLRISSGPDFQGSPGSSEISFNAVAAGTFTSATCSATDVLGNTGSGTDDYTISETSTSGGSTGGSGGGTSSGVSGQTAKKVWTSLNAGDKASVPVTNGAIGVTEVSFGVKELAYGAWVQVKKQDSFPSNVASPEGKQYRKLQITTSSTLKDGIIDDINIDFKVEKKWLIDNGFANNQIDLFRNVDGKWVALNARVTSTSGDYVLYSAETPGFSYFVIAEKKGVTPEEVVKETTEAEADVEKVDGPSAGEETAEASSEEGKTWPWVVAILVVVVAGIIYWWKTK